MAERSTACSGTEAGRAPVLVIGIGNPSRGDDALGPACIARLEETAAAGVELLTDFQLQIEHALDLDGRSLVVFVDASVDAAAPFHLARVGGEGTAQCFSHALSPAQLLGTYRRVYERAPPPAWVLAIRGYAFELGAPLSEAAGENLRLGLADLQRLLRQAPGARGGS